MGRGIDHFYNEGSLLNNHVEQPGEREAKARALDEELLKKRASQGHPKNGLWEKKHG
jgi:hypothetical protein